MVIFCKLWSYICFFTSHACLLVDISLFDDLDGLGDADELLQALVESVSYVSQSILFHLYISE